MTALQQVAADPYPWPWDGAPDPRRLVLVAAGWDQHWQARGIDAPLIDDVIARLARLVIDVGGECTWIAHELPARAPAGLPAPTPLARPTGATGPLLTAAGIDAYCGSALDALLRRTGRDQLLIVGHGLEGPVHSTMRSANDRGYECLLVIGASSALTTDAAGSAVASVTMSGGIFGAVAPLAAVERSLGAAPTHPDGDAVPTSEEDR